MKVKREEEIRDKETEVVELRRKYFGPEGELFKKRESLMKPIQDDIYNAIKKISEDKGYMMVIDRASSQLYCERQVVRISFGKNIIRPVFQGIPLIGSLGI